MWCAIIVRSIKNILISYVHAAVRKNPWNLENIWISRFFVHPCINTLSNPQLKYICTQGIWTTQAPYGISLVYNSTATITHGSSKPLFEEIVNRLALTPLSFTYTLCLVNHQMMMMTMTIFTAQSIIHFVIIFYLLVVKKRDRLSEDSTFTFLSDSDFDSMSFFNVPPDFFYSVHR